jgi:hypothetical protein
MNNSEFFRPYPSYEDVFYDDIENHKKYFLPICSVNLKFMFPDRDEWVHFISVKEIFEGCVGENTFDHHTNYTKEDMFGFDIIDGKYKFDASWEYFDINYKEDPEYHEELNNAYNVNTTSFEARKKFYEKHGKIFPVSYFSKDISLEKIEEMEVRTLKDYPNFEFKYPEYFGMISDIKHQSKEVKDMMSKYNIKLEDLESFNNSNIIELPKDGDDNIFEYIGRLTGFFFQKYAANSLYVFQNRELKKAVICLEYT